MRVIRREGAADDEDKADVLEEEKEVEEEVDDEAWRDDTQKAASYSMRTANTMRERSR